MPVGELEYDGCVRVLLLLSSWPTGNLGVVGKEVQRDHTIRSDVEVGGKIGVGISVELEMLRPVGSIRDHRSIPIPLKINNSRLKYNK